MPIKWLLISLFYSSIALTQTVAIPTFNQAAGTYINSVFITIRDATASANICYTLDGTTPTATVAGTCDVSSSIYGGAFQAQSTMDANITSTATLQAIGTKVGLTNSAVMSATYTITSSPALTLMTNSTPVNVTHAVAPIADQMPHLAKAANGNLFLFISENQHSQNLESGGDIPRMLTSTDNGASWQSYAPSTVSLLHITNIGSGYSGTPTCAISAPTSGTTATCTAGAPVNGAIPSVTLTAVGSGYGTSVGPDAGNYNRPTPNLCTVTGGGGSGATCIAWVNDHDGSTKAILGVAMTGYGSGYTRTPSCAIVGSGTGATCSFGAPVDGAITSLTLTGRGTGYTSVPTLTISGNGSGATATPTLNACNVADPPDCFYNNVFPTYASVTGAVLTYKNTLLTFGTGEGGGPFWPGGGVVEMRSTDNGATWSIPSFITTPSYRYSAFDNATANPVSIPPGSPGVTGPCASGCVFTSIIYAGNNGLIFSYDDGLTWSDPVNIPTTFPYSVEERALIWAGGMKLLSLSRPSWSFAINGGWPTAIMAMISNNLGATWTKPDGTNYGIASNLPTGPCGSPPPPAPTLNWRDEWTKPSLVTDPANPNLVSMLYGERFACSTTIPRWRIVTFDPVSAFNNNAQNLPMPQILALNSSVTAQLHTTYSSMVPLGTNSLLMTYEQGNGTTTMDVYTTVLSYVSPGISGGMTIKGGITQK